VYPIVSAQSHRFIEWWRCFEVVGAVIEHCPDDIVIDPATIIALLIAMVAHCGAVFDDSRTKLGFGELREHIFFKR
jgi:hypothetical protein